MRAVFLRFDVVLEVFGAAYIVTDPGDTGLDYKEILTEMQYREAKEEFGNRFQAAMGGKR